MGSVFVAANEYEGCQWQREKLKPHQTLLVENGASFAPQ